MMTVNDVARGARFHLRYRNAEGEETEREIRVYRSYRSHYGQHYLEAFCYLTGEKRTFRMDRVISLKRIEEAKPSLSDRTESRERQTPAPSPTAREAGVSSGGVAYAVIVGLAAFVLIIALGSRSGGGSSAPKASASASVVESAARIAMNQTKTGALAATGSFAVPTNTAAVGRFVYRDYAVIAERSGRTLVYTVPALGLAAPSLRSAYLEVNARLFEMRTGIRDPRIEAIYASADTDGNGHLSWAEIVDFQQAIYRVFKYKANSTALRPDEFLDQHGGDCEDWALFTAGLLHYWGWNAYIATFDPPDGATGHAVTFVRVAEPIPGIGSYTIDQTTTVYGRSVPAGTYVPIDYSDVGGFTTALQPDFQLAGLYNPESLYDKVM